MQSLPYELLQHVARGLLPRHQCRLALTSRQNYDCLYSPLLRWHAQKSVIMIPKHNIIGVDGYANTLIFTGKHVVLYRGANIAFGNLFHDYCDIINLSTYACMQLRHRRTKVKYHTYNMRMWPLYDNIASLPREYLKKHVQYLHKNVLLVLVNTHSIPYIDHTGDSIRKCIKKFLSKSDRRNIKSCEHLFILLT